MNIVLTRYKYSFRNLVVWKESHALTLKIYKITHSFPSEEKFGITSQMRRAASSVGANIAEGTGRKTQKDQKQFYCIAKSSLSELDNFLELAHDLGYLDKETYHALLNHLNKTAYLLHRLIETKHSLPS